MRRNELPRHVRRRGIMMLEALIAATFFAVTMGLALKIHQQSTSFDHARYEQLATRFQLENVAERIAGLADDTFADEAAKIAEADGLECKIETFEAEPYGGTHVTLASNAGGLRLTHHVWRLQEAD
ncbi:type IV pilus modification PilV family protein [Roseiconus lacunae]|uniref:type IV pilus modification PilV family protein n=1 Tax=Roseiconus lacunae TaxID=2605694 RepID=UPI0011F195C1|nr:hypothetical protein [Roseiconus lacunae]MCD0459252.1 hypothetical protein [Roseiconus lacunae]WRQ53679.1 hypothetical protein U8335_14390 [Stieleria sp. HD01]